MIVQTGCPEVLNRGAKIIFIEKRRSFPASYEQGRHAALARSLSRTRNVFLTKMDTLRRQRTAGAARLNCHMPDTNILCSRSRLGRAARLNCHMPDTNILCSRSRLGRAARLNCHMPDANILCSRSRLGRAACLNCHMPDTNILCFRNRLGRAARLNCHMPDTNILCSRSRLGRAARLNCHMPDENILCSRSRLGRAARLNCHVPGAKIIFIEINIKNVLDGPDGACYIYVVEKQAEPRSHPGAIGRPGVHRYVLIRYSMTRWLCAAWFFSC